MNREIVTRIVKDPAKQRYVSACHVQEYDVKNTDPYTGYCTILYDDKRQPVFYVLYSSPFHYDPDVSAVNRVEIPFQPPEQADENPNFYLLGFGQPIPDKVMGLQNVLAHVRRIGHGGGGGDANEIGDLGAAMLVQMASFGAFEKDRQNFERSLLFARCDALGEAGILRLLKFNGVSKRDLRDNLLVKPTLKDRQHFYRNYPTLTPPRFWFHILAVDAPTLGFRPLYPGGYVHLPYCELKHWFWQLNVVAGRRARTNLLRKPPAPNSAMTFHLDWLCAEIDALTKPTFSRGTIKEQQQDGSFAPDIEDLPAMLPPCTRPFITNQRFPVDGERTALVAVLAKAKISLATVGGLLDRLNDRYPHQPSPKSTKSRWDYEYYYNKHYGPPYCDTLPACMKCPFNGDKQACLDEFHAKWPQFAQPYQLEHFFGPHNWPAWVRYYTLKKQVTFYYSYSLSAIRSLSSSAFCVITCPVFRRQQQHNTCMVLIFRYLQKLNRQLVLRMRPNRTSVSNPTTTTQATKKKMSPEVIS